MQTFVTQNSKGRYEIYQIAKSVLFATVDTAAEAERIRGLLESGPPKAVTVKAKKETKPAPNAWKPGMPGRKPKWYTDQQEANARNQAPAPTIPEDTIDPNRVRELVHP